ncbi:MAG: HepT-like ribonuclease domain-containing protein [Gemmatimonadota bacterium]
MRFCARPARFTMLKRDLGYLTDMLLEARRMTRFVSGLTRQEFRSDDLRHYAVLHALMIFGEAASRTSNEAKAATPSIPWRAVNGMRNRIVHEYSDIDLDLAGGMEPPAPSGRRREPHSHDRAAHGSEVREILCARARASPRRHQAQEGHDPRRNPRFHQPHHCRAARDGCAAVPRKDHGLAQHGGLGADR